MQFPRLLNRMRSHLKKPLKIIRKKCGTLENYGKGTQAIGFYGKKYVYKLSPKNIGYFRCFHNRSVKDFKSDVRKMHPHFLKVDKIIYADKRLFVYKQRICNIIKGQPVHKEYLALSILAMIIAMIKRNLIVTDIGPHNIGIYKNNILTFDLQGIKPFDQADIGRLSKNLEKYLGYSVNITSNTKNLKNIYKKYYKTHVNSLTNKQKKILKRK